MANLLLTPGSWQELDTSPVTWDGTSYLFQSDELTLGMRGMTCTGSVVSGDRFTGQTESNRGVYVVLLDNSGNAVAHVAVGQAFDWEAIEGASIVLSDDTNGNFYEYYGLDFRITPNQPEALDEPRHLPQKKTLYCAHGETRLVAQQWAGELEERGASITASVWEFTGGGVVSEQRLSGSLSSVILTPTSYGRLSNTVQLDNDETLVAWRYVDVTRYH